MDKRIITKENDMYIFFEIINQIEPDSILDVGMFLKRIGAISRHVKDTEISCNVRLDGVEYMPDMNTRIHKVIYDNIFETNIYRKKDICYRLAILMEPEQIMDENQLQEVAQWLTDSADYVLTDMSEDRFRSMLNMTHRSACRITQLEVDNDKYILASRKES